MGYFFQFFVAFSEKLNFTELAFISLVAFTYLPTCFFTIANRNVCYFNRYGFYQTHFKQTRKKLMFYLIFYLQKAM